MAANQNKTPDATGAVRNQTIIVVVVLLLIAGAAIGGWYYYNNTIGNSLSGPLESPPPQAVRPMRLAPTRSTRKVI